MSNNSATFEVDFKVLATTDKGRQIYVTISDEIEVSGEDEMFEGYRVFFNVDEDDYDNKLAQLEEDYLGEEESIYDCECRLAENDLIDEDECVVKIEKVHPIVHDFEILSEDTSFDYGDTPNSTHTEHAIHGFSITTFGSEILLDKLVGYGEFENVRSVHKIRKDEDLYYLLEAVKHLEDKDNFENIADIEKISEFQRLYLGEFGGKE